MKPHRSKLNSWNGLQSSQIHQTRPARRGSYRPGSKAEETGSLTLCRGHLLLNVENQRATLVSWRHFGKSCTS